MPGGNKLPKHALAAFGGNHLRKRQAVRLPCVRLGRSDVGGAGLKQARVHTRTALARHHP